MNESIEDLNRWAYATLQERERHFGRAIVPSPVVSRVDEILSFAHQSYGNRFEGRLTLISGDSRIGKTIACEQYIWNYAEAHGGRYLSWEPRLVKQNERDAVAGVTVAEVTVDGEVTRPIVMVQIGVSPTYQGVMRDLIFSVAGHAPPRTTNNLALVQILTRILGKLGTQLLIFDESQRIAQSMNGGGGKAAAEAFRAIMKATKIEVAIIGTDNLHDVIAPAKDLYKMVEQDVRLDPFEFPSHGEAPFIKVLKDLQAELPFDSELSDISNWRVATRLHRYSGGILGEVTTLVHLAVKHAMSKEAAYVDMKMLEITLRERLRVLDTENPFFMSDEAVDEWKPSRGVQA